MKYLLFNTGGRPLANDDLDTLQDEMYGAMQATLQGAPPMVLSGCQVTINGNLGDIAPGFIWLAGNIQRFMGASGVTIPAEIVAGPYAESDIRPYQTGGSKACMSERELITQAMGAAPAGTAKVVFYTAPVMTYQKWLKGLIRDIGEVQWVADYEPAWYDSSGKGYIDRDTHGWALCNGKNKTKDLQARFVLALDPSKSDYDTIGKTGGEEKHTLTAAELPNHDFGLGTILDYIAGRFGIDLTPSGNKGWNSKKIQSYGGGQAHENRPPYYVLVARQWIGF